MGLVPRHRRRARGLPQPAEGAGKPGRRHCRLWPRSCSRQASGPWCHRRCAEARAVAWGKHLFLPRHVNDAGKHSPWPHPLHHFSYCQDLGTVCGLRAPCKHVMVSVLTNRWGQNSRAWWVPPMLEPKKWDAPDGWPQASLTLEGLFFFLFSFFFWWWRQGEIHYFF